MDELKEEVAAATSVIESLKPDAHLLDHLFRELDADEDGLVSREDLERLIESGAMQEIELEDLQHVLAVQAEAAAAEAEAAPGDSSHRR